MKEGNYSCVDIVERADAVARLQQSYLDRLEELYQRRQAYRKAHGLPCLAWCGYGRAGKDTSAEIFCEQTKLVYPGSCSLLMLPLIAQAVDRSTVDAWRERHDYRQFWFEFCNAFRRDDPTRLLRMTLAKGDVSVGIRGRVELKTGLQTGVLDYAIWVANPTVPVDPTVEYGSMHCDMILPNHGNLAELRHKIAQFVAISRVADYAGKLQAGIYQPFKE